MIAANELRVGNWFVKTKQINYDRDKENENLYLNDEYFQVKEYNSPLSIISNRNIKPVPLTEEILLKCGFEKGEIEHEVHGNLESWQMPTYDTDCEFLCLCDKRLWSNGFLSTYIESVHQLQNLYFALTGTELEIKL